LIREHPHRFVLRFFFMTRRTSLATGASRCRRKFLRYFKRGFRDESYIDWERGYKDRAYQQWREVLSRGKFEALLGAKKFSEITAHAVLLDFAGTVATFAIWIPRI
jgi:hypothetical protein